MKREVYTIWQNLWNSRITCCSLKKAVMCQSMNLEHHYTMFNPEIDFAKVFETHTPLKIEYQDA